MIEEEMYSRAIKYESFIEERKQKLKRRLRMTKSVLRMDMRDYFAGQALAGISGRFINNIEKFSSETGKELTDDVIDLKYEAMSCLAYDIADAMLKERSSRNE